MNREITKKQKKPYCTKICKYLTPINKSVLIKGLEKNVVKKIKKNIANQNWYLVMIDC